PDHRHGRLLRSRREWPRRRAAEHRDELTSLQPIEWHLLPLATAAAYGIARIRSGAALRYGISIRLLSGIDGFQSSEPCALCGGRIEGVSASTAISRQRSSNQNACRSPRAGRDGQAGEPATGFEGQWQPMAGADLSGRG